MYRTTPKMAGRKEARRKKLLRAAVGIFGRKGYHATSVPMIVRAAHSSVGSFYSYFENKEDAFARALEALGGQISSALNEAIGAAGPDVLAQMRAAVTALVRYLAERPEEARVLIVESSGLGSRLEAVRRQVIESHTRGVEQGLLAIASSLPPLDTAVVASCWVGSAYEAVYRWLARDPKLRPPAEQLAETIAGFNLRGIGAPTKQKGMKG